MLNIQKKVFTSWEDAEIHVPAWNTRDKLMMKCPKCSDDRKLQNKNKKVLSVALAAKLFNCHHCGYSGKIVEKQANQYFKPEIIKKRDNDDLISDAWKEYLMKRGIDIQVALNAGCLTTIRGYPSKEKSGFEEKESIVFPYNDSKGNLLFYKYRSLEKDFSGSKSPQYVFWQLENFKSKKVLIVTEGEYDTLSWQTAFARLKQDWYSNGSEVDINDIAVTSVPNGAVKKSQDNNVILEYFERCIPFVSHFEQIYLSTDNDENGLLLQNELSRRFGKDICKIIKFPNSTDQKDANGVLMVQGEAGLQKLFNEADFLPIEGIFSVNDVKDRMDKGLGVELLRGDTLGYSDFDELISFDKKEGLVLITGAPNSAKSDFMFNIMIRLSLRNSWKWLISSPETGSIDEVYKELLIKLIGKTYNKTAFQKAEIMSKDEYEWGMDFLKNHIYVMDSIELEEYTLQSYIQKVESAVKKYGINGAVIDPFNAFDNAFGEGNMSNKLNSDLLMLQTAKRKLGVNFFVVAHPKSMLTTTMVNPYDVNGGAAWYNKVDFYFMLNRGEPTVRSDGRGDDIEVKAVKVKKRHLGKRGEQLFAYHIPTGRFGEIGVVNNPNLFQDYNDILANVDSKEIDFDPFENIPQVMPRMNEEDFEKYF